MSLGVALIFVIGFDLTLVLRLFNIYTVGSGEELPAEQDWSE